MLRSGLFRRGKRNPNQRSTWYSSRIQWDVISELFTFTLVQHQSWHFSRISPAEPTFAPLLRPHWQFRSRMHAKLIESRFMPGLDGGCTPRTDSGVHRTVLYISHIAQTYRTSVPYIVQHIGITARDACACSCDYALQLIQRHFHTTASKPINCSTTVYVVSFGTSRLSGVDQGT